ncbi:MAG TPA: hypothetical protein VFV75_03405 [Candidatus Polarisedimenticolaceae bacterium]|nr:hypothetical protein [Candidatus Polarisedimenticolaceae bacterium]
MLRRTWLAPLVLLLAGTALAQAPTPAPTPVVPAADASSTREALMQILGRHPSEVGEVLARAPQLLANHTYMEAYPELEAFIAQHPEVGANPAYYFVMYGDNHDARTPTLRFWEDFLSGLAAMLVCAFGALLLVWLVKTVLEQRRWSQLQRVQAEVHQKVLDRLGSNEQLLAYIETPAGRRFLQSAPILVDGPRPVSAPIGRVLWSMQVGLVLVAAGLGILIVSGQVPPMGGLPLRVVGVATLSIGIGFAVASLASFALSRRLGLLAQPEPSPEL